MNTRVLIYWFILFFIYIDCGYAKSQKQDDDTINCLQRKKLNSYTTYLCQTVVDPLKFKNGEWSERNCLTEIEDGYSAGICEKVDVRLQFEMRNEYIKRIKLDVDSKVNARPKYFAGKDEICLTDEKKEKPVRSFKFEVANVEDVVVRYSAKDSEAHCFIENPTKDQLPRFLSLSDSKCQELKKHFGRTIEIGFVDDHVCVIK
ncbi:MAG: hypothetical protein NT027_02060 [Proteobacteria bacterium]|nr:hypothetical protein [Pseudomonadota bacterium]